MRHATRTGWGIERLLLAAAVLLAVSTLRGSLAPPTIGQWNGGPALSSARAAAAAVRLNDGRLLLVGGEDASGPVATAEILAPDGTLTPVAPMLTPRSRFVAALLADGRVLVAGGVTTGGGVTNAAELYDPTTNQWTAVPGGMIEARAEAAGAVLSDGRVLIAGGRGNASVSATAEIFDPQANGFSFAGTLGAARSGAAAALLVDGRVLIVGGADANGTALASTELYDPFTATFAAGPAMASPRLHCTATPLLNGLVLVAGGTNGQQELASLELYDPASNQFQAPTDGSGQPVALATARQNHAAWLLPHNGAVLVVGGTASGQALASAELFSASIDASGHWSYQVSATGTLATARTMLAAGAFDDGTPTGVAPGLLVAAGGDDSTPQPLASTEVYGFPTVRTDQSDYPPGATVTVTGTGWQPGETVTLTVTESPLVDTHPSWTAVADSAGQIRDQSFVLNALDAGVTFYLTAVGTSSGRRALTAFSDASIQSATITIEDSTCTTAKTSFLVGDTVCASVLATVSGGGSPPDYYIVWSRPNSTTAQTTHVTNVSNNSTYQDHLTLTGTNAVTGTWTVKTCKNNTCTGGGNVLDSKTFTVAAQPPQIAKAFSAAKIAVGATTTLSFTLSNPNPSGVTLTGVSFTDTLPTGLVVASPNGLSSNCSGTATATAGSSTVSLSGASLAGGASCTVTVDVQANGAATGTLTNTVTVNSTNGGTGNTATAQITVYQQYTVTFAASGLPTGNSADTTGTVVNYTATQLGTPTSGTLTAAQLGTSAAQIAVDAGTQITFTYATTLNTAGAKRYTLKTSISPNPSPSSPQTVNANVTITGTYVAQWPITFAASGLGSDATGTVVSYNGTQAGSPASGTLTAAQLGTPAAQIYFDEGSSLSYTYSSPVASSVSGKRYILDGSVSPNPNPASPQTVSAAATVTGTYKAQWQITFAASGLGGDATGTVVSYNGTQAGSAASGTLTAAQLGTSAAQIYFDEGSSLSYTYSSPVASTVSGKRYILDGSVSPNPNPASPHTVSAAATLTGTYKAQYDTTTTLTSSANPSVYGQSVMFTATVATVASSGPTPTGSVQFSVDGSPSGGPVTLVNGQATVNIATLTVGSHTIAATYTPDTDSFTGSSDTLSQTVNKANTTTTLSSSVNPSVYGQSVTFTATVAVVAPGAGTPTGTVSFYDGATPLGTAALSGNQAQLTTAALAVGSHSITAQYSGDGNFNGSPSAALSQTVNKADTTTTLSSSANPSVYGQSVTFTATVAVAPPGAGTPTGTVSFYDGATLLGTAALSGNQAQLTTAALGVGSHSIKAEYNGDGNFNGSTSAALSQQVNYGFLGLQSPYAPPPTTFNVKRTMPLKWQYTDVNGNVVNSAAANPQVIIYGPYTCGGTNEAGTITVNDAGNSGYQYDTLTNTWQFNWQIKGNVPGCYDIYIKSQQSGQTDGRFPISVVNK